mgnify:CR=1 FL=1
MKALSLSWRLFSVGRPAQAFLVLLNWVDRQDFFGRAQSILLRESVTIAARVCANPPQAVARPTLSFPDRTGKAVWSGAYALLGSERRHQAAVFVAF